MAARATTDADEEGIHKIKLLVIGDSGTGKTSLLLRYCDQTFSPSMIATIGVDFKYKAVRIDGTMLRLQVWDTAGQEKYRTITDSFFRGSHGILLVYDVTDVNSFRNIRDNWLPRIAELTASSSPSLVLIGNKSDRDDKRRVTYEEGLDIANEAGMLFFETSAKSGAHVDDAFVALARDVKNKRIDSLTPRSDVEDLDRPGGGGGGGGGKCPC
eukprot:c39784_g1_i1.p1 GENE.c39784_g1_i1~~c39784_g1_i1.p1  ORF type:complete len:222 (-),score=57.06 c39784_g1_i1:30-668(-)